MNEIMRRRTAAHLALEMLVVVTSILIAFALDAWWSRRDERRTEVAHLRALQSDFEQNVEQLEYAIEREEGIADASRRLLIAAVSPNIPSPEDSLSSLLLGGVLNSGRFDPVLGAYEAIISSGGLSQLRDESLRLALANFAAQTQGRYTERFWDEVYLDFIRNYTGRLGFTAAVAALDSRAVIQATAASRRDLLSDPEFREHLALRHLAASQVARAYEGMLSKAQEALALVDRALDGETAVRAPQPDDRENSVADPRAR